MKCPSCNSEWPNSVKFCGKCGTKMSVPSGLGSEVANEVNNRLKEYLPKLGLVKFSEAQPGIHVGQKGSTHVEVRVIPVGPRIAVRSVSPVTIGTPITQDLLQFLLTENANILFGAFGIGPRQEIIFSHTIMATSMDEYELGASVSSVVNTADKYDDQIVQKWGGRTARKCAIDQVVAPALLKAILNASIAKSRRTGITSPRPRPSLHNRPKLNHIFPGAVVPDASAAIKVNSVMEEYEYLAQQRCSCGGCYNKVAQVILKINGLHYDELSVSCQGCGNRARFLFDINSFLGR